MISPCVSPAAASGGRQRTGHCVHRDQPAPVGVFALLRLPTSDTDKDIEIVVRLTNWPSCAASSTHHSPSIGRYDTSALDECRTDHTHRARNLSHQRYWA